MRTRPVPPTATRTAVVGAGLALLLGACGVVGPTSPAEPDGAGADATGQAPAHARAALDALIDDHVFPAALAHVDLADTTYDVTAGVGDLASGADVPVDGQVRIASNTKTFTATVVLQLVGEGEVALDEPVETYLPGLLRGDGIDGSAITVRQLLQHTSGLPNYTLHLGLEDPFALRDTYLPARELLDVALEHPALFAPGERWEYSNTNYTVLGLLIEAVTGRPYAEQVTERIIEPLALEHTYVPLPGERELREDHPRGYHPDADGELADITRIDPSWGGAAGEVVSTPGELTAFFEALVGGELLEPAQLAEMQRTVEMPPEWPGDGYGLGLSLDVLSCGVELWGHGGDIFGYSTRGGATSEGAGVTLAVTALPTDEDELAALDDAVDTLVCD
ncbi:beta-lactamase family protein [Cellulomonas sp. APG4]|uniref:serine hydrolase domain-containing protein n=1 Tax=Cellulomonas sp. APG4 TaxID=1538656 RepID=UPI00137A0029|nr:serine hydrolase domain-containing protein [Cellulomonas sp. APG4]NCT92316.1 beta-lactamase family protein [Cellulomonas sp. APG4]